VQTTLVDSEGNDENGKRAGPKYNALTGPFYIEGAKPGDTLVVRLKEVRLNAKSGFASTRLSENAITAVDTDLSACLKRLSTTLAQTT
jgi:acetamidase/formamidase